MEGESSKRRRGRPKQMITSEAISYERSVENLSREGRETLTLVTRRRRRSLNTINGTSSVFFDNSSPHYNWLHSGWLAEERRMLSNRLYRYYYDPKGQTYNTRQEVEVMCKDLKKDRVIIILDD